MIGKTYIFLDYDGVVACARECTKKTMKLNPGASFVPEAVEQLNRLVGELESAGKDVRVVPITSRLRWLRRSKVYESLENGGFTGIIDKEQKFSRQVHKSRSEALVDWCKKHLQEGDEYIILDNNYPKKLPSAMQPYLVKTDSDAKLTAENVEEALAKLGVGRAEKTPAGEGKPHGAGSTGKEWGARVGGKNQDRNTAVSR